MRPRLPYRALLGRVIGGYLMIRLDRLRLQPDARLTFLQGFLRKPQRVGSVIPSSRFLERRVVQLAQVRTARTLVELGPGTGGTTRGILRALPAHATLLCVEIDAEFAAVLERIRDPRLIVHRGSAIDLRATLSAHALPPPEAVISGIPFSTIRPPVGHSILEVVRSVLAPGGLFVAYQVSGRLGELGCSVFGAAELQVEFRNIPPLRVYRWQKPRHALAVSEDDGRPSGRG